MMKMKAVTPNKELQKEIELFIDDIMKGSKRGIREEFKPYEDIMAMFYGDLINAGNECLDKLRKLEN